VTRGLYCSDANADAPFLCQQPALWFVSYSVRANLMTWCYDSAYTCTPVTLWLFCLCWPYSTTMSILWCRLSWSPQNSSKFVISYFLFFASSDHKLLKYLLVTLSGSIL
jgi:hypothetical protein